jgi:trk system potassium uptake protein
MDPSSLKRWYTRKINQLHPTQLIFFSYLLAISIGALLLSLPIATVTGNITLIDAIFTAASAVCVTGLVVVDTGTYFTAFGQGVILVLIQLGGIGIMTFSVAIFRLIGRQISFRERMAVQDVFTHTNGEDIYKLLKSIFIFAFTIELVGIILLFAHWFPQYPWNEALYLSVFHGISAFCNAGFALFEDSLIDYRGSLLLNVTIGGLIVLGGIGFPVVYDLYHTFLRRTGTRRKLLAQTKVVLATSVILIAGGAVLFWLLEQNNTLAGLSSSEMAMASLFQSITARTAGFNTIDIAALTDSTLAVMLFLMFFGASPGSCGGGVKTTTLALVGIFALSRLRQEKRVNFFKKSVPVDTITKSIVLILLSTTLIGVVFFLLLISDPLTLENNIYQNDPFLVYLFETVSAFGTVGLSMGATPQLTALGKLWIIVMMLIGRVGVLTIVYVVVGTTAHKGLEYAEEKIMVG